MFKILGSIVLTTFLASSISAGDYSMGFYCSNPQTFEHLPVGWKMGGTGPQQTVFYSPKEVKFNNNKTLDVWLTNALTPEGHNTYLENGYDVGIIKVLYRFDYINNKMVPLSSTMYKCDGNVVSTKEYDGKAWSSIVPFSVNDWTLKKILETNKP